ncbi:hypothetical protein J2752_000628 [Halarchaeum rubridurum]|uniref:Glycoside hydrolase domain protein n=1 Tax=Halarchaeum rubridurum TaxID=489911 RepID=A0A830FNA2_9EURY|nr:hypothetical protein [Halarchaeum rubridurum]MBP1953747.1 hypothetical protein [Halarchaeum rubridurum]GGM54342.1 hypothetical protein GCM10009017_00870 [Halarchaeum rubridurum]
MYGIVTRNAEEVEWPEFDVGFYEVKRVTGQHGEPVEGAVNLVSCFADTASAATEEDVVAVDAAGRPATTDHPALDAGHVCPSDEGYRNGLYEVIEACARASDGVRLDEVGFPGSEFCHCERCEAAFAESEYEERGTWRASVLTSFVAGARERVPGDLYVTLHPDPYPGHLRERSGIDLEALAAHVDEFVVPLYDTAYGTTYWLESLASGFADRLADLDVRLGVELYAVDPEVDALADAAETVAEHADGVYFGYQSGNARAVLRRWDAEAREGVEWG